MVKEKVLLNHPIGLIRTGGRLAQRQRLAVNRKFRLIKAGTLRFGRFFQVRFWVRVLSADLGVFGRMKEKESGGD
jgi:hypothetical protein